MQITAAASNEFDSNYFVGANKTISFFEQFLLKISSPFYSVKIFLDAALAVRDKNIITMNKKKMTGQIVVSTSPKFYFPKIKSLSKKLGVTINDIVMCALSTGVKEYFKIKGDPLG